MVASHEPALRGRAVGKHVHQQQPLPGFRLDFDAQADELAFDPGQEIVREGSLGETLFVVMEGRAKVTRNGRRVGEVLPGDFFGELSTIDGGPRTASITAVTPVRVVRLFRRTLRKLLEDEPQLTVKILDGIVRRIRQVERRSG